MTEGGLQKLTEYLNQTRRQAETAIDTLNERIFELEASNAMMSKANDELNIERTYLKDLCEQLKGENSRKWRLQERDDWKSLVDSVQADRVRLQEETMQLNMQLEQAHAEIERQAELLHSAAVPGCDPESRPVSPDRAAAPRLRMSSDSRDDNGEDFAAAVDVDECDRHGEDDAITGLSERSGFCEGGSPTRARSSSRSFDGSVAASSSLPGSPSPRATGIVIQQLKLELEKVNDQRLVENQIAETEIRGLKDEIERLQHQLQLARGNGVDIDLDHQTLAMVPYNVGSSQRQGGSQPAGALRTGEPSHGQWSLSFGLWDFFFSSNEAPHVPSQKTILRV